VAEENAPPKRKATDVLQDIERTLSTIDGIATADAFKLGQLVREYGEARAGEAVMPMISGLIDMMKPPKPKNPWEAAGA
jgi:hypothetical protein